MIPHEVLEAMIRSKNFCGKSRVALFIIRKTLGFHKQSDYLSLSQIASATGLGIPRVSLLLKQLEEACFIIRHRRNISINFGLDEWWDLSKKRKFIKNEKKSYRKEEKSLSNPVNTKEEIKKTETREKKFSYEEVDMKLAKILAKGLAKRNYAFAKKWGLDEKENTSKAFHKILERWADAICKMRRIDKCEPQEIYVVLVWVFGGEVQGNKCEGQSFWWAHLQSGEKLRKHYPTLVGQFSAQSFKYKTESSLSLNL
jgi:hypothetical protein